MRQLLQACRICFYMTGIRSKCPLYDGSRLDNAAGRAGKLRMGGAMRPRQIRLRAHLDQARSGALEFLRLEAFVPAIKPVGLSLGGSDELNVDVIERVDKDDEALCRIARLEGH